MRFQQTWSADMSQDGTLLGFEPTLTIDLLVPTRLPLQWTFLVDSGAEWSMAPRELCELLGLSWEDGLPLTMRGISPRDECNVQGRIHDVEIHFPQINRRLVIPICFVTELTTSLLGRHVFFDAFRIEFDQPYRSTVFECLLDEQE